MSDEAETVDLPVAEPVLRQLRRPGRPFNASRRIKTLHRQNRSKFSGSLRQYALALLHEGGEQEKLAHAWFKGKEDACKTAIRKIRPPKKAKETKQKKG